MLKQNTGNNLSCRVLLLSIFLITFFIKGSAQEYLQLEITGMTKVLKFSPGQKLVFKSKEYPKDWQKKRIDYFIYEKDIVVFQNGYIPISEITEVRTFNGLAFGIAKAFYIFSARTVVFTAINSAYNGVAPTSREYFFAIGSAGMGYFLDKVVSFKKYKMGKKAKLRLLDLRMY